MNKLSQPIGVLKKSVNSRDAVDYLVTQEETNESFFVCNVDDIITKYKIWNSLMPRIKPYYAVKCNDHPIVLKVLAALGLGFDCSSKGEIDKILSLDIERSRIIYAHTAKPKNHLKHAAKCQVKLMTFDNELELYKIKDVFPDARSWAIKTFEDYKMAFKLEKFVYNDQVIISSCIKYFLIKRMLGSAEREQPSYVN